MVQGEFSHEHERETVIQKAKPSHFIHTEKAVLSLNVSIQTHRAVRTKGSGAWRRSSDSGMNTRERCRGAWLMEDAKGAFRV